MPLPTSSNSARKQFHQRISDFEALIEGFDSAPEWARNAFGRAFCSMPLLVMFVGLEEKPTAFKQGFISGLLADFGIPLLKEMAKCSAEAAAREPSSQVLKLERETMDKIVQKFETALSKRYSSSLVAGDEATKDDFLRGMAKWNALKPRGSLLQGGQLGNMATEPHLYLAVFWREFSELKSIKEAYFALFCMFDKNLALAGTFESFRKRAQAIGLSYP